MIDPIAPDAMVFPASPGQERLWFLAQMSGAASSAYSLAVRVELHGVLDQVALQDSVNAVLARHEALRTGLRQIEGRLVQVVLPGVTSIVRPVQAERSDVEQLLRQEVRRGWNLAQSPLVRCLLLCIAPDQHILLLCVHHIVCDGLSLQIVLDELIEHYQRGGAEGAPSTQFADYVVWNSGDRADQSAAPDPAWVRRRTTLAEYWTEALRGAPDMLELPADHRPPLVQSFAGAQVPVRLDADLAHRVRGWAARAGVTPFTALLSAFVVVLARNSGSDDLVVGLPVANRKHPDLARTVGYLANICPLRADLRADPPLRQVVRQVHASLTGLLDHSELPFGDLVKMLAPARRLDKNPVFQVMFGLQQNVRRSYQLPDLRVRVDDIDAGSARVDLSLFLFEDSSGEITGFLEYASALFTRPTAERLTDQLHTVLRQLVADVELPVSAVRLADVGVEEPARTLGAGGWLAESWNVAWPQVIAQAVRQPTAIALRDDHRELSYQQLAERIEAAGALLQRHRVRPGDRVAVHVERGVGAVVAMLACWRAGTSYVPIDPAAPAPRRKAVLEDADPLVVVCDDRGALPAEFQHRAIAQDTLLDAPMRAMSSVPIRPDGVAYLMFTSGSTGRPKGVSVSHRNLASLLRAMRPYCQFTPNDRLLALTTTSFDISLLELLGPLVDGGTVVVAPSCTQRDGTKLATRLSDPEITIAQATPAIWRLALTAGWRPLPGFRVLCGGEAMPPDLADSLASRTTVVHNLYGPTETTVWSCSSRVAAGEPVTIGLPIPGTRVLVVDTNLNEVPVEVCGELLIGGPGVAMGYLGHSALTAARFLPDPGVPGQRVYRTGDLVRWRSDGTLEFVGRADEQVKVRGHRVELGEIESVLRGIEGVLDAAVTMLGRADTARPVGYLVASPSVADDPSWPAAVRKAAAELLPASMVPAELYVVRSIPLSPNGKVDRRALAGTGRRLEVTIDRVAPRTDAERKVAALWCELLDAGEIGATDDFFALGGHSLLAAQLLQRVESELGVRVPIAEFFIEPTVARIAGSLPQLRTQSGGTAEQPTPTDAGQEPVDWDFEAVHLRPRGCVAAEVVPDVSEEARL